MLYYKHSTDAGIQAFMAALNSNEALPLAGMRNGVVDDSAASTTAWATEYHELVAGGYVIPKIPDTLLDALNIDQATRDAMLAAYNIEIVDIEPADIVQPEEIQ